VAGLLFSFAVPGDTAPQILRRFERLGRGVTVPFRFSGRAIANDFLTIEEDQFAKQGARGTQGWAALKPRTLRNKPPGLPILQRTGRLEAALASRSGGHLEVVTDSEIQLGVKDADVPYAKYHQSGTLESRTQRSFSPGRRGMPRRPVIETTEQDRRRWLLFVQRGLISLQRQLGTV